MVKDVPDALFGIERYGLTKDERVSKCYEIAGYALTLGSAPTDATLVHGSVHHVALPRRIDHAWLVLSSRMIWEPISGRFWVPIAWERIIRAHVDARYTQPQVNEMILKLMHWGPWQ